MLKTYLALYFGLKECGFYASEGGWSTPSLCLLVFSVRYTQNLFRSDLGRVRETTASVLLRSGRCIYLPLQQCVGWAVTRAAPPPAKHSFLVYKIYLKEKL